MAKQQESSSPEKGISFRGRTVAETMQKVTQKLGRDAVILEKREVRDTSILGGFLGGGDEMVEIIASSEEPQTSKPERSGGSLLQRTYCAPRKEGADKPERPASPPPSVASAPKNDAVGSGLAARLDAIEAGMKQSLRKELQSFVAMQARGGLPAVGEVLLQLYRELVDLDVLPATAAALVESMQQSYPASITGDAEQARLALEESIAHQLPCAGAIALKEQGPTVIAFVGPTGVGKTTTVAKLAVEFVYKKHLRVGILNEDVRRPGAEAQLNNLSQLLGLSVLAADSPELARAEMDRFADMDVILVDTAGRVAGQGSSPENLAPYLKAIRPDETHLVLSAERSLASARQALRQMEAVPLDRIVFSKIDEGATYGMLLDLMHSTRAELSYVTSGREYMEALIPAEARQLARLIVGLPRKGEA